jgi:radical SAM-linked protein
LPNRLGIQFSVDAEARFLSHHDTMRLMARAARRAGLPVAYSGGFNPRPRLSLPLPRPVGIAGRQELLVLELAEPIESDQVVARLAAQVPAGLKIDSSALLAHKRAPQAESADYELPIPADQAERLTQRLRELETEPTWPCTRRENPPAQTSPGRRASAHPSRCLELRELVMRLSFDGRTLSFTLAPRQQVWARVDEVLALVGLDAALRASITRTTIRWQSEQDPARGATDGTQE